MTCTYAANIYYTFSKLKRIVYNCDLLRQRASKQEFSLRVCLGEPPEAMSARKGAPAGPSVRKNARQPATGTYPRVRARRSARARPIRVYRG